MMNDDQTHFLHVLKLVFSWLAVALSGLTVIGFVNIFVGLLSACWLAYQLYVAIRYDLPVKKAKAAALRNGHLFETKPGDLK